MIRIASAGFLLLASCSPAFQIKKQVLQSEKSLHDQVGFYLAELNSSKPIVDFNGATYFTPASNTKIFTLYTSLRLLGDSLIALKYIKKNDSLFFQGMGDPSFLYSGIYNNSRTYLFLKNTAGNLFFNSSNFQTEALGPGWAWDDYNYYYSAERSSFPIYGNLIAIQRMKDGFNFQPKRFAADWQSANEKHPEEEMVRSIDSNHLIYYPSEKKNKSWQIPFRGSPDLTAGLLSDTLHRKAEGVMSFPSGKYFVLKSIPVDSAYKPMMTESDNFIAEQLLLQCAAMVSDTLKPEIAIRYATQKLLSDLPDAPQWVDGSGLSRFNLFTPRSIVTLWKKIYAVSSKERLFALLAVGGKSGTLKKLYKSETPYIFGKTGSLSNVQCLSGFLITKKNKILVFSFMRNNFTSSGSSVRQNVQSILEKIRVSY